VGQNFQAKKVL
jgi:hypothetical protein